MTCFRLLAGAVLASSLCAPLAAQQLPHPITPGSYRFETHDRTAKGPVCTEQWDLRADGTMTFHSGEEIVESRYRLAHDRDGDWVITTALSTNGKPDCTGKVTQSISGKESRIYILAFNDGSISVCPAPGHTADGTPITSSCYASLKRVEGAQ
ncbi:MAG: hypothetical protein V4574_13040 [Pseudomonadota bacterium]